MSSDNIEFSMLDAEPIGNNTVTFRLSDGTEVKVRVDVDRAGVALNYKNPDGSPHYAINTNLKMAIIPKDRKFTIPASEIVKPAAPLKPQSHIT